MRTLAAIVLATLLTGPSTAQVSLTGAGSTFVAPIMDKWIAEYVKEHPGITITYLPNGSGAGIAQSLHGMLDFGGTDAPVTDDQMSKAATKVIHIPVIIGSDVPAYNLPSITSDLRFTPDVLARIFLGQITNWNDAAMRAANPGVPLPEKPIVVVHRSDGSGTTYVWTDYLCKVSPEWNKRVGKGTSVKWPVGIEGKGNEGVSAVIRQTDGSIGYLELSYAIKDKVAYGLVENSAGRFVKATPASTSAAAASETALPSDLRVSISNAPGPDSYPIASFSWVLIPTNLRGSPKGKVMAEFFTWVLTDGQKFAPELFYAPLPKNVAEQALQAAAQEK